MTPIIPLREALANPNLLGIDMGGPTWEPMRSIVLAAFGERLTESERVHFRHLTERDHEPLERVRQLLILTGRRTGKSKTAAHLALYVALMCRHDRLSVGEKAVVLVISQNVERAKTIYDYAIGLIDAVPSLGREVAGRTSTSITFKNGVEIQVCAASFRGLRGLTCAAVICDEVAFWRSNDSANPDREIIRAVLPTLLTTKGTLIMISTPYAKSGVVWEDFSKYYGANGVGTRHLVARGPTLYLNSNVEQWEVDEEFERDAENAKSEYLCEFRNDLEAFIDRDIVASAVVDGRYELPRMPGVRYVGFTDPSGGSGADSFTCAVAHLEGETVVLDAIRERRPPMSTDATTNEFSQFLKSYGVASVEGDAYGGDWPLERFRANGIKYTRSPRFATEIYREFLPLINSKRVELLDHPRMISQLINLERSVGTGRERISHPKYGHDDLINAVAGAVLLAASKRRTMIITDSLVARTAQPRLGERASAQLNRPASGRWPPCYSTRQ